MDFNAVHPGRTEQNTVCFTGHRSLNPVLIPTIRHRLRQIIRECAQHQYRWFMCGGALGFDTMAALEVLEAKAEYPGIRLFLAIPCADQAARWAAPDRQLYQKILSSADDTFQLSEKYYKGCMHIRNQFMVQHASVCVCYLREFSGGTGFTVRYALSQSRKVINLYLPEDINPVHIKEQSWNSTFISLSASANAHTAHSIPLPAVPARRWNGIHLRFSGKHSPKKNF